MIKVLIIILISQNFTRNNWTAAALDLATQVWGHLLHPRQERPCAITLQDTSMECGA